MKFIDIFPIAIGTTTLASLTTDMIRRAIELIDGSDQIDSGADGTLTRDQQFLNHSHFDAVRAELIAACKEFSRGYAHEVHEIGICNSWANVVGLDEHIPAHKHNNSYISGTIYLTGGSALSIVNPNFLDLFGFMPRIIDNSPRSWGAYLVKPEPGTVVMFPSGLQHGVSRSRSNENRYSIAFNAIPLGPIGNPTSLIDLRMS